MSDSCWLRGIAAAAKYLDVPPGTFRKWLYVYKDDIPYTKRGRNLYFHTSLLDEWFTSKDKKLA